MEPIPTITNMFKLFTCAWSLFMKDVASSVMILKFTFNGKICMSTFFMYSGLSNVSPSVPTLRLSKKMLRIWTFLAVYDTNLLILYTHPLTARSYTKFILLSSGTRCGVPEAEIWLQKGALFSRDAHSSFCF